MVIVIVFIGIGCVVAGLIWGVWWIRSLLFWSRARGIIIGLDDGIEVGDKLPRIEFTDRDGKTIQFTSRFGVQMIRWWPIGRSVVVLYDPEDPCRAEVLLLSNAISPIMVIVFGVLIFLVGLGEIKPFG
ncbi:MAG TPA: DUF3592 domain-containing protein [Candidatus Brocadiia bacterium]|nr:DUF3592 domain-containing protein [Candidatus Brocadiia bacterium]